MNDTSHNGPEPAIGAKAPTPVELAASDSEYLRLMGDALRAARARRGMTRKMLATQSGVSERFLAQLEGGTGNASILVLRQVTQALDLPLGAILPGSYERSAQLAQAIELLRGLDASQLSEAWNVLLKSFRNDLHTRRQRIALIGLRGAGKSTVGRLLADRLELPFFELDRLIEQASGVSLGTTFDLYGQSGFRRFEHRCLENLLLSQNRFVVATGGGLVSEPATYDRLLTSCYTLWLRATAKQHMLRVVAQGDMRPMAQNPEAMSDLERILAEREPLYGQADVTVDTSDRSVDAVLRDCLLSLETPHIPRSK